MTSIESVPCDVSTLEIGDAVHYLHHENGGFLIEKGILKEGSLYSDGVTVYGEDWKQYVSKWYICKVERDGLVLFDNELE